ncbi:hypothetical protein K9N68_20760 [Kovacikia minuta CCNUW1]|uniref:hypothetical protein n=1 Tax=Kovacikia minuta TaxID=2931930 RepID=UPI001CCD3A76|nr:hypothetical protein [Kovacikia minuta]UBF24145.1 hypothetical protein K9N68_20760 [Kovacikia minuta CCNUW1]
MQVTPTHTNSSVLSQHKTWKELNTRFKNFKQGVAKALLMGNADPQVHQFRSCRDLFWYTFDPRTGQTIYADSEAELRLWIEQNYYGR